MLPENCRISVGLNGCDDGTASKCGEFPVFVGTADTVGYGHGCLAGIEAANSEGFQANTFIFFAADGANRPEDVLTLIDCFEKTKDLKFVMGIRKFSLQTWSREFGRALPNLLLGLTCTFLGGQFFHDLAPLRLIETNLFKRMQLREKTWGWTIEAQIRAAQLGEEIHPVPVIERERTAGEQKVSGVSLRRSLQIGLKIAAAGFRTRFRGYPADQKESAS